MVVLVAEDDESLLQQEAVSSLYSGHIWLCDA